MVVGGYVTAIAEVDLHFEALPYKELFELAEANNVRCPDPVAALAMTQRIRKAMDEKDTLGGVIEVVALGLPPGLGSFAQWDRRLEARLGAAVLSVQAVKGVEIGPAFANARLPGTQVHDPIRLDGDDLVRLSNRAGGPGGRCHQRRAADRAGGYETDCHHLDAPTHGGSVQRGGDAHSIRAFGLLPDAVGGADPGRDDRLCFGRCFDRKTGRGLAR